MVNGKCEKIRIYQLARFARDKALQSALKATKANAHAVTLSMSERKSADISKSAKHNHSTRNIKQSCIRTNVASAPSMKANTFAAKDGWETHSLTVFINRIELCESTADRKA